MPSPTEDLGRGQTFTAAFAGANSKDSVSNDETFGERAAVDEGNFDKFGNRKDITLSEVKHMEQTIKDRAKQIIILQEAKASLEKELATVKSQIVDKDNIIKAQETEIEKSNVRYRKALDLISVVKEIDTQSFESLIGVIVQNISNNA